MRDMQSDLNLSQFTDIKRALTLFLEQKIVRVSRIALVDKSFTLSAFRVEVPTANCVFSDALIHRHRTRIAACWTTDGAVVIIS